MNLNNRFFIILLLISVTNAFIHSLLYVDFKLTIMKKVISATIALLLTLNLSAQTTQFSEKEQDNILKLFTKTFKNKESELDKIEKLANNYFEEMAEMMTEDVLAHPFIDSIYIDSLKEEDYVSVIMTYNSDNQSYTINVSDAIVDDNDEWEKDGSIPLMHFYNTIYYSGGIESVVKSTSFTFSFTTKDTTYDVVYEFVNQNGSTVIGNRYIQKTP